MRTRKLAATFLSVCAIASALSGCAITSSHSVGPNGGPVHFIDAMSASVAYEKASELCPRGYTMVGSPNLMSPIDYTMTIECKTTYNGAVTPGYVVSPAAGLPQPAAPQQVPAQPNAPAPAAAAPATPGGTYTFEAERLAKAQACQEQPRASLMAKGPGFETYSVRCANGDALTVRCEFGNCRVLQ